MNVNSPLDDVVDPLPRASSSSSSSLLLRFYRPSDLSVSRKLLNVGNRSSVSTETKKERLRPRSRLLHFSPPHFSLYFLFFFLLFLLLLFNFL